MPSKILKNEIISLSFEDNIDCFDVAENIRIRTYESTVQDNLCDTAWNCILIEMILNISLIDDSG